MTKLLEKIAVALMLLAIILTPILSFMTYFEVNALSSKVRGLTESNKGLVEELRTLELIEEE